MVLYPNPESPSSFSILEWNFHDTSMKTFQEGHTVFSRFSILNLAQTPVIMLISFNFSGGGYMGAQISAVYTILRYIKHVECPPSLGFYDSCFSLRHDHVS